jgi:AAA+ ATPase superfamily predicted ATPase
MLGRKQELELLKDLERKKTASLVCVRGRRRIGKSTLVKHWGAGFSSFVEIQGLAPREAGSNAEQLEHFARSLQKRFKIPGLKFADWSEAFSALAKFCAKGKVLIFLDEISWMGKYDSDFAGKLKIAWDTEFKENNKLILVLCGSVSSWISENILQNTGFVGRISANLKLEELPLRHAVKLLGYKPGLVGDYELVKVLAVTGGVPKYLEEIDPKKSAEQNIERLALNKNGAFFNEFEQIFSDFFGKRSKLMRDIIFEIAKGSQWATDVSRRLKLPYNSDFSALLEQLVESGFLSRQRPWDLDSGKESSLWQYRVGDNFLHFYLKFIEPLKSRIEKLPLKIGALKNWESIVGYQFQNVVYANLPAVLSRLGLSSEDVMQLGPYFQRPNTKQRGCQIDLLIQTRHRTLYFCEIKCQKELSASVEAEIAEKIASFKRRKGMTIRPVLVYSGELSSALAESEFIDQFISVSELVSTEA